MLEICFKIIDKVIFYLFFIWKFIFQTTAVCANNMHNQTKLEERYPFVSRKAMNYFYGSQSEDANFTV